MNSDLKVNAKFQVSIKKLFPADCYIIRMTSSTKTPPTAKYTTSWWKISSLNKKINMTTNFINEIYEFAGPKVHIKNRELVNCLLNKIIRGGSTRLQIVSDFDRTITKQHENGKVHMSSFGTFEHCPSVPAEYLSRARNLYNKYYPLEMDNRIPYDEKRKLMEEWWYLSELELKGLSVSPEEIDTTVAKMTPSLREGTYELFRDLDENQIPVLVFSAGLGDTVVSVLKYFKVLYPNVKVVSNFLKYDENGLIQGFQGKTVHLMNKNEYALEGSDYYDLIQDRDNVILMGDSLGDAGMADGVRHANAILKIGFLYDNIQKNLPVFMDTFDIVLEDDQTMDLLRAILKQVF